MSDSSRIDEIVNRVASQVLERHIPQLRDDLVTSVVQQLQPELANSSPATEALPAENGAASLLKGITAIHAGGNQREILRALLDNTVRYSGRSALFVIKGGTATGWEGRGFSNNDEIKNFDLDLQSGLPSRAMQSRMAFSGGGKEMDSQFISQFHASHNDEVLVLPLLLKDKVAALVYADAGTEHGTLDQPALELLVAATSAWLEVISLRKQAHKDGGDGAAVERVDTAPVQTVSSYSDPFAGHAPRHIAPPAPAEPAEAAPETVAEPVISAEPAEAMPPAAGMSAEDAEVHRKAQRFARLLVDEIKLYNQAKVSEGRKNKDIYDRLKEEIDKSRTTWMKRYGNTSAAGADYFSGEVVRSLAEDDSSLMGANFRR
jgi:hypothetical protein